MKKIINNTQAVLSKTLLIFGAVGIYMGVYLHTTCFALSLMPKAILKWLTNLYQAEHFVACIISHSWEWHAFKKNNKVF